MPFRSPDAWRPVVAEAQKLTDAGDLAAAFDVLESAIQQGAEHAEIAKFCARLSLRINEIRAFTNWCHEALRIDPADPEPHDMLAEVLTSRGRHAEAAEERAAAESLRARG